MKISLFRKSEVIAYLEDKILTGMADNDDMELYADYKWGLKLNKNTYRKLMKEMKTIWNNEL